MGRGHGESWSRRIDGFAIANSKGYLIEAKGLGESISNFKKVANDIERLGSTELQESLKVMFEMRGHQAPNTLKKIVLADCWNDQIANVWSQDIDSLLSEYSLGDTELQTKSIKIGNYGCYPYYLLVGQVSD